MFYTSNPFDRADQIRKDDAQIDQLWQLATTKVVLFYRGKLLVANDTDNRPAAVTLSSSFITSIESETPLPIFLGFKEEIAHFALDCSHIENEQDIDVPKGAELQDLRAVGPLLSADDGSMLAYTRAMVHWQQQTLFCSLCGHSNTSRNAGHVKVCTNPDCAKESFPRTDPAVIMLVVDPAEQGQKQRCLLGRSPAWPNGVYSTLAGFVEPGETLEHAVAREVFEEAGIVADQVTYVASQPWPFPQSIMLGFRAVARTTDITIDPVELGDANWFSREELTKFGNWGDDNFELQLPRPDSIARHLINSWMAEAI